MKPGVREREMRSAYVCRCPLHEWAWRQPWLIRGQIPPEFDPDEGPKFGVEQRGKYGLIARERK